MRMRAAIPFTSGLVLLSLAGCRSSTLEEVNPDDVTLYEESGNAGVETHLADESGRRSDAFTVLMPKALAEAQTDEGHAYRALVLFAGVQRWMTFNTDLPGGAHAGYSERCTTPAPDDLLRVADSCLRSKQPALQRWAESTLSTLSDSRSFAMLVDHLAEMHARREVRGARSTLEALESAGQSNGAVVRSGPKGSNPMELETPWRTIIFGSLTPGEGVDWDALGTTVTELRAWLERRKADLAPQVRFGA